MAETKKTEEVVLSGETFVRIDDPELDFDRAEGHGGNLTVNVNHGDYIFIFKSEHEFTP